MFGIGNTIGAGVFALTGVAAQYAGKSGNPHIHYRPIAHLKFLAEWTNLWDDCSGLC